MPAYQLDRCSDYPALCTKCVEQGLAYIFRFSVLQVVNTTEDPDILALCQQSGRVLLTTDGTFHTDNEAKITEPHSGILIVNTARQKPLTSKMMVQTLDRFKAGFGKWHLVTPNNAILYLTEDWVDLYRVIKGRARWDNRFNFHETGWQDALSQALTRFGATWSQAPPATLP